MNSSETMPSPVEIIEPVNKAESMADRVGKAERIQELEEELMFYKYENEKNVKALKELRDSSGRELGTCRAKIKALEKALSFYTADPSAIRAIGALSDLQTIKHVADRSPALALALATLHGDRKRDATSAEAEGDHVRHFLLVRDVDESGVSGTGVVADVCQFESGWVAVGWRKTTKAKRPAVYAYPDMDYVKDLHGHGGKTRIVEIAPGGTIPAIVKANEEMYMRLSELESRIPNRISLTVTTADGSKE